jgi:hypothetical protein
MSLIWNVEDTDIVAASEAWHVVKSVNRGTIIQFSISDRALNCIIYIVLQQTRFLIMIVF